MCGPGAISSRTWAVWSRTISGRGTPSTLPLISVQFHPERMTGALARPDTVDGGAVFREFLRLCGKE